MGSTEVETTKEETSQMEKTLEMSDKGKGVAKETSSSSRGRSSSKQAPRWLHKEMIRSKKPQFTADEEDMIELVEVLNKLESPSREMRALTLINNDQNQD